ncbi:hypothetical protein CEQ50_17635 [Vibrio anguillarum]|nr:hypothetical protein CEG15_17120 [Vibrio anguillarum]ASG09301.1 hypothetical protein CEQ50_17635 [Vibrio anguillarum]
MEGWCSTRLRRDIIQMLTNEQVGSVYSRVLVLSAMFCLTGFVAKIKMNLLLTYLDFLTKFMTTYPRTVLLIQLLIL